MCTQATGHDQFLAITVSGQSVHSGYQRGWAIPETELNRTETGRCDTKSFRCECFRYELKK